MSRLERLSRRLTQKRSQVEVRPATTSTSPGAGDGAINPTPARSPDGQSDIRKAKKRISAYTPSGKHDKKLASCLNAFLNRLPRDGARAVANDILDCGEDDEKLYEVFFNLFMNLLLPMKATSRLDLPSASPEHEDWEEGMDWKEMLMAEDCRFRDTCFQRDNHKCPVTGAIDIDQWARLGYPKGLIRSRVEAAYIIPLTYEYRDPAYLRDYIQQRWATLHHCFPGLKQINLSSTNLKDSFNGLSLEESIHRDFSIFKVAFQEIEPNSYRVKTFHKFSGLKRIFSKSQVIKYNAPNNTEDLAPPDPRLLAVHLTIAEILCDCGLGDDIDKVLKDLEGECGWGLPHKARADAAHLLTVAFGTA